MGDCSCPLVMIEWEDSVQPTSAWKHLAGYEPGPVMRITSVGWLIHDGETKVLAPNLGGLEDADNAQFSGAIQIPTRCVIAVRKLKEPGLSAASYAKSRAAGGFAAAASLSPEQRKSRATKAARARWRKANA